MSKVKHIVIWDFLASATPEHKQAIKADLEALKYSIPGVISLDVCVSTLPQSNADMVLDSVFESAEALSAYQVHPAHVEVAARVREITQNRRMADYIVE